MGLIRKASTLALIAVAYYFLSQNFNAPACIAILGVIVIGFYFLKQYLNGPMCESKARLDGKVVIVTGANTGKNNLFAVLFLVKLIKKFSY